MKKLLSVLLMLTFILTTFIGCKNYNQSVDITEDIPDTEVITEENTQTILEHKVEIPQGFVGIYTAEDFQYICNNPWCNYILMNDIDFSEYSDKWESTDVSIFDGNNYTISNYQNDQPLFGSAFRIYDLNVTNAEINCNGNNPVSILCEVLYNFETFSEEKFISNCNISGNIYLNCTSYLDEDSRTPERSISGIVSSAQIGSINNCSYNGNITLDLSSEKYRENRILQIGGVCGNADSTVSFDNNITKGNININENIENLRINVGGVIGGVLGSDKGNITNCVNYMNIILNNSIPLQGSIGGIIGKLSGNAYGCSGYIERCSNFGAIQVEKIFNSKNKNAYVGGICGEGNCNIMNCFNTGEIKAGISGGIIGQNQFGEISTSYNVGNISGSVLDDESFSGLKVEGAIEAFGSDDGKHFAQINYCYYIDSGINPVYKNTKFPYVFGLNNENALLQESYKGFDFENIWEMGSENYLYPMLKNSPVVN